MDDGKAGSLRLRSGQALTGRSAPFGMTSILLSALVLPMFWFS